MSVQPAEAKQGCQYVFNPDKLRLPRIAALQAIQFQGLMQVRNGDVLCPGHFADDGAHQRMPVELHVDDGIQIKGCGSFRFLPVMGCKDT